MATTATKTSGDEERIRGRIDGWAAALRAKDIEGVMAHYAPEALSFDLAPPLRHRRQDIRKGLAEWFPTWVGPIGCEHRDLEVTAGGDVAFAHGLNHLTGKRTGGERTDVWFRSTVCLRKIDGEWLIVHEHASVPFYMDGSFRASVDLKP